VCDVNNREEAANDQLQAHTLIEDADQEVQADVHTETRLKRGADRPRKILTEKPGRLSKMYHMKSTDAAKVSISENDEERYNVQHVMRIQNPPEGCTRWAKSIRMERCNLLRD